MVRNVLRSSGSLIFTCGKASSRGPSQAETFSAQVRSRSYGLARLSGAAGRLQDGDESFPRVRTQGEGQALRLAGVSCAVAFAARVTCQGESGQVRAPVSVFRAPAGTAVAGPMSRYPDAAHRASSRRCFSSTGAQRQKTDESVILVRNEEVISTATTAMEFLQ
eukprot:2208036-Rhodomonas_salina.2